jgi:hypothetical protein
MKHMNLFLTLTCRRVTGLAPLVPKLLMGVAFGVALSACDRAPPHPVAHAMLHIAADGSMELDQSPVSLVDLGAAIQRRKVTAPDLLVEIHASPQAAIAVVEGALHTVVTAHARLSYGEEHPAQPDAKAKLAAPEGL